MTTLLNLPLQQAYPETIRDLQERFPHAHLRIEIRKKDISKILTEQRFWEIISLFDWTDAEDNDRVLTPAINALSASPVHHIYLFADMLAVKLHRLDAKVFAENIGDDAYSPNNYFSVDNFLYARCCVIANGQKAYESVLQNPVLMPKNLTFESLLSLASKAYSKKTGKKFDYVTTISMETYANKKGWQ
ncbi:MAG: DUF4240 domain-containing protein [Saprospiraceae bacterium]|nr:DUF4240 domain-containing protein [Saprospiraceae bacterium]